MSVTVELSTSLDAVPLKGVIRDAPNARIDIEPRVHSNGHSSVWIRGIDPETIAESLASDAQTASIHIRDQFDEEVLADIEWTATATENGFFGAFDAHDAVVLKQVGTARGWEFTLRFPDTDSTQRFQQACHEAGVRLTVHRVVEMSNATGAADRLTDAQHEVFRAALERGYFDIPRRTTLVDLAEEFDISDQAVSERLRRAQKKVGQAVLEGCESIQR